MPTTATICPVSIADLRDVWGLLRQHYDELTLDKRRDVLDPDWGRYEAMERANSLFAFAAYVEDEIVGYSVTLVGKHLHYVGTTVASNDVLYLTREHRGSRLGLELIRHTEGMAKAMGADVMLWHAKEGTTLQQVLPRLGYGVQDVIYSRSLPREGD